MATYPYCLEPGLTKEQLNTVNASISGVDYRRRYNTVSLNSLNAFTSSQFTINNFCQNTDIITNILNSTTYRYNNILGYNRINSVTGNNNIFIGTNESLTSISTTNSIVLGYSLVPANDCIFIGFDATKGLSIYKNAYILAREDSFINISKNATLSAAESSKILLSKNSEVLLGENTRITVGKSLNINLEDSSKFLLNGSSYLSVAPSVSAIFNNSFSSNTDSITFGSNTKLYSGLLSTGGSSTIVGKIRIDINGTSYYIYLNNN